LDIDAKELLAARALVTIVRDVIAPEVPPDVVEPATLWITGKMKSPMVRFFAQLCFVLLVEVGFAPAPARLSRVFDVEVPPRATDSCPLRASFLTALAIFYGLQDGQGEGGQSEALFPGVFSSSREIER
jgi:hypothetical protein